MNSFGAWSTSRKLVVFVLALAGCIGLYSMANFSDYAPLGQIGAGRVMKSFTPPPISALDGALCPLFQDCPAKTDIMRQQLAGEIAAYEKDLRFQVKIDEAKGLRNGDGRQPAIMSFLKEHVLIKGQTVLDLGCAAGAMLHRVTAALQDLGGAGSVAGVELVTGWVKAAREISPQITFVEKDITELTSADLKGKTFDLITLYDVMEHVQKERYGCLFQVIKTFSHENTMVYFHIPTPRTQLAEQVHAQYYENIIFPHTLIAGMACSGFVLDHFEYNVETACGDTNGVAGPTLLGTKAKCVIDGAPKYMHLLFHRDSKIDPNQPK